MKPILTNNSSIIRVIKSTAKKIITPDKFDPVAIMEFLQA